MRTAYFRLFRYNVVFHMWIRLFDRGMSAAPMLLLVPSIYSRVITFGDFMQAWSAYETVQGNIAIVAHAWPDINELRSA